MLYDDIGHTYARTRRADPRIAAAIFDALGDAQSVVNIGAGAGSYEPPTTVAAIEPSRTMIRQRSPSPPVIQAVAEALPVRGKSADAALAVLTVHHWSDLAAGIAEMVRVARRRLVFFTWRPEITAGFWLLSEYLPAAAATDARLAVPLQELTATLPGLPATVVPVPVPHDCIDGFATAYWRRPEAYLDPQVRAGISMLAKADPDELTEGLTRLEADIDSGNWQRKHADLLDLNALDVGNCTVTVDLSDH